MTNTTQEKLRSIEKSLPKSDAHFNDFCRIYLNSIPAPLFNAHSNEYWTAYLKNRYTFVKGSISKKIHHTVYIPKENTDTVTPIRIFEFVVPDAPYLLFTFQELFKEFDIKVTKILHPIFGIELDSKSQIKSITPPSDKSALYSATYIEFEDTLNDDLLAQLEARITYHIDAILTSFDDRNAIYTWIEKVKPIISSNTLSSDYPNPEWSNLLDWLKELNFTFFGFTKYTHTITKGRGKSATPTRNEGLGILSARYLKSHPMLGEVLDEHVSHFHYDDPFVFDTITAISPIQRFEQLMRLSIKEVDTKSNVITEYIFLGLLKRSSLLVKSLETPIIHLKMEQIFKAKHMLPGSYNFNEVIRIFTTTPKFELFRSPVNYLMSIVEDLFSITNPNDVYLFEKDMLVGDRLPIIAAVPSKLFNSKIAAEITKTLAESIPHISMEVVEIRGYDLSRLHIYFTQKTNQKPSVNIDKLQDTIRQLIKPWDDQLMERLSKKSPSLSRKYGHAFPDHYKTRRSIDQALIAVDMFEAMEKSNSIQFAFIPFSFKGSLLDNISSLLTIFSDQKIDLIHIMPILQNLGLYVYDEYITKINNGDKVIGFIHSFRVADQNKNKIEEVHYAPQLIELLKQVFHKGTSNDPLIGLVLKTQLNWRAINVLEMYRNFLLQLKTPYHSEIINNALLKHPHIAELLYTYFHTKFSPKIQSKSARSTQLNALKQDFAEHLRAVQSVSEDVILRRFMNMIDGTLRTNFFIPKENGDTFISIKVNSSLLDQMPRPVPYREIYVYDVGVEGTHLRFGPVARGGLRWSTRLSDFRTEVLGLVKTQQSKNVVIVPVGSKGGFIVKEYIDDKDKLLDEAQRQYRKFISGLLDVTDSIQSNGKTTINPHVVCYDDPDPYLVVAADKGTAAFSDYANDVSQSYKFWLDDAFASGGSHGYNHKVVGITAKGGWECVKLHFRERGLDIQTTDFTVAGVGDMSGDVFGNGMLLSECIRLQAAFNHIHIFIDPNPDSKISFKERHRLFHLPSSTWRDYNASLISKGGGVFDRKAKEIPVSPEMKALLGIKADVVNGEELIRAILTMHVDLLWFGGIGTYVKSASESHNDVGDPPNDSVRIDADECNALVIGEGANLGVTQRGRVDLSLKGIALNSDAIDNSAGVNMSDYEVNIKILLQNLLAKNVIKTQKKRNEILEKATDEVTDLVLKNNRGQHRLISIDTLRSKERFDLFNNLIRYLIAEGHMDTKSEYSPPQVVLDEWNSSKKPLTRSLLGGYQAYVKMMVANDLSHSTLISHPHWDEIFVGYFPASIKKAYGSYLNDHQLKSAIITTQITNKIVNNAGSTFFYEVLQSTGRGIADTVCVYEILNCALNADSLRDAIYKSNVNEEFKYDALAHIDRIIRKFCISILSFGDLALSLDHAALIKKLVSKLDGITPSKQSLKPWISKGFDSELGKDLAQLDHYSLLPDVIHLHINEGISVAQAHILSQSIDSIFQFEYLKQTIGVQKYSNAWDITLQDQLLNRIRSHKLYIIRHIVSDKRCAKPDHQHTKVIQGILKESFESQLDLYFKALKYIRSLKSPTISQLSVVVNHLNNLGI